MEVDAIETTVCSTNLILRPDSLSKQVLLHMYCIGGKCVLVAQLVFERIKAEKEAHGKCGTCAQTSPSRQVSHMVDFDPAVNPEKLEACADGWMLDHIIAIHIFNF
jgi:hypothetical protein